MEKIKARYIATVKEFRQKCLFLRWKQQQQIFWHNYVSTMAADVLTLCATIRSATMILNIWIYKRLVWGSMTTTCTVSMRNVRKCKYISMFPSSNSAPYMNEIQFMLYSRIAFNIILNFSSWDFTFIYPQYQTNFARELTNASFCYLIHHWTAYESVNG